MALAAITAGASSASAQTFVSTNITTDTTWGLAGSPYILQGPIFVKDGAILTIDPGVVVRGQPRNNPQRPGSLVVTRNGQIDAEGTASAPIIFTTAAVDVNDDGVADGGEDGAQDQFTRFTGTEAFLDASPATTRLDPLNDEGYANLSLWGGVVVLGNATINRNEPGSTLNAGEAYIEGIDPQSGDGVFGGNDDADNSGIIKYVSIRHAGDEIDEANELNGLTLAGVGSGTTVDYVDIYCNFDDGVEIFGGAVNPKHLSLTYIGDDALDIDQGYHGDVQFVFVVMTNFTQSDGTHYGSKSGDKACEWDGDDWDEGSTVQEKWEYLVVDGNDKPDPFSRARVFNMTVVGSSSANKGQIHMRHGFSGWLANSIVVNTGTKNPLYVQTDSSRNGEIGYDVADNEAAADLSTWAGLGAGSIIFSDVPPTFPVSGSLEEAVLLNGGNNYFNPTGFSLRGEDQSYTGNLTLNPRPNASTYMVNLIPVPSGLTTVAYRGAFPVNTLLSLWTTGWTAINKPNADGQKPLVD